MDKKTKNVFFDIEMLRRRLIRPYFIELGLTVGQGQPRILKELREHGIMNQKELADACLMDVTTMSRTLDRMEKDGLLKRENNPASRRSWNVSLILFCVLAYATIKISSLLPELYKNPDSLSQALMSSLPATIFQLLMVVACTFGSAVLLDKKVSL